jgi:hypothetical protein
MIVAWHEVPGKGRYPTVISQHRRDALPTRERALLACFDKAGRLTYDNELSVSTGRR